MRIGLIGTPHDPLRRGGPAAELAPLLPEGAAFRGYPSRVPAFPYTPVEQALQQIGHLDAALTAADDGCAALVIDSLGDYGLAAIRAALAIPVVGAGEAGMAAAAACGRFAIVTVWPRSMNFIPEGLLNAYGHADACLGIANVGGEADVAALAGPDGYLARVRSGEQSLLATIDDAIAAAHRAGAQAVLLGCTCMSPLAERLTAPAGVTIVNPLAAGVTAALTAQPPPPVSALRPGRRELIDRMIAAVADQPAEDCPVCITTILEPTA